MTPLERLALRVSARISGADLVLVLDYIEALKRETRIEALHDALAVVSLGLPNVRTVAEQVLREFIEKETADGC
jgi:hypothetical protein